MFLEIVIVACVVCVLIILYQQNVIRKIRKESTPDMTLTPSNFLKGGRMDIIWRDAQGKPYNTTNMGMPENVRMSKIDHDENTLQITFTKDV